MAKTHKAIVLLSGGLDSMLAAKLLVEAGIETIGLAFKSNFFGTKKAEAAAEQIGIPIKIVDFSEEHLETVKHPPRGYGRAANPCIDCHLLMLKMARQIMENEGFDFVATGEVLGERPFSQNKRALLDLTESSGLKDRLLRPLSAKLLPETLPQKMKWVNEKFLLDIQGRCRQKQFELAKKYKLSFPQPAGGCLLTEKEFGKKLFDLFKNKPAADAADIALLSVGRHSWFGQTKIVLGKNKEENEKLEKMAKDDDCLIIPQFPGPTALLRGKINPAAIAETKKIILSRSKKHTAGVEFRITKTYKLL